MEGPHEKDCKGEGGRGKGESVREEGKGEAGGRVSVAGAPPHIPS